MQRSPHDMQLAVDTPAKIYLGKKLSNGGGGLRRRSAETEVAKIPVIDN